MRVMLNSIISTLRGLTTALLLGLNLTIIPIVVIIIAPLKYIPIKPWQRFINWLLHDMVTSFWVDINTGIIKLMTPTEWEITHDATALNPHGWYFLISNHQTWLDILILQAVFNRKVPSIKFFMKQELLWSLPIGGLACWFLDYPFMKRHSKEYLKKHPEQREKDIETTRQMCQKFKNIPVTITNFVEGTRFSEQKRKLRHSPYQHLLQPKAGGIAFTLATMDGIINHLINATIVYQPSTSLWDFACGKMKKVHVHFETSTVPEALRGDYYHDKAFRKSFQQWLNQTWAEKDKLITELKEQNS